MSEATAVSGGEDGYKVSGAIASSEARAVAKGDDSAALALSKAAAEGSCDGYRLLCRRAVHCSPCASVDT